MLACERQPGSRLRPTHKRDDAARVPGRSPRACRSRRRRGPWSSRGRGSPQVSARQCAAAPSARHLRWSRTSRRIASQIDTSRTHAVAISSSTSMIARTRTRRPRRRSRSVLRRASRTWKDSSTALISASPTWTKSVWAKTRAFLPGQRVKTMPTHTRKSSSRSEARPDAGRSARSMTAVRRRSIRRRATMSRVD